MADHQKVALFSGHDKGHKTESSRAWLHQSCLRIDLHDSVTRAHTNTHVIYTHTHTLRSRKANQEHWAYLDPGASSAPQLPCRVHHVHADGSSYFGLKPGLLRRRPREAPTTSAGAPTADPAEHGRTPDPVAVEPGSPSPGRPLWSFVGFGQINDIKFDHACLNIVEFETARSHSLKLSRSYQTDV